MNNLEDLSYSKVVDIVDTDPIEGRKLLIEIFDALQKADTEMKMLEKQLQRTKSLIQIYNNGIEHVFSHLKLKKPLFIHDESRIITFNHNEADVSLNVL